LAGLLTRDADRRLGSGPDGANDVKRHPFFKDIDWEKLLRKEVEPSFKPKVKDAVMDTSQIDTVFTGERPEDSLPDHSLSDTMKRENDFTGFTFVAANQLDPGNVQ